MNTWNAKPNEVDQKWWIVDATDKTLGRLASEVTTILRGKHKPQFTPHVDTGDFVVVVNSAKVAMTGRKWDSKVYYRHTGYFGAIKETSAKELRENNPEMIITKAVKGMLPDNKLATKVLSKLKVYAGADHPHRAQKPQTLNIK